MVGVYPFFATASGPSDEVLEIVVGLAVEVVFSALLVASVIGFFVFVSRLDGGFDSPDSSVEPVQSKSRQHRFGQWLTLALPTATIAIVVGYLIWDTTGIFIGAVYGLANAGGTAYAIRHIPLGKRAQRALIGACLAQLPIGILTLAAEGV